MYFKGRKKYFYWSRTFDLPAEGAGGKSRATDELLTLMSEAAGLIFIAFDMTSPLIEPMTSQHHYSWVGIYIDANTHLFDKQHMIHWILLINHTV